MVHQFGLRSGSAGVGKWHGGEGVIREIEFLEPLQVSILSEVSLGSGILRVSRPLGHLDLRVNSPFGLSLLFTTPRYFQPIPLGWGSSVQRF